MAQCFVYIFSASANHGTVFDQGYSHVYLANLNFIGQSEATHTIYSLELIDIQLPTILHHINVQ